MRLAEGIVRAMPDALHEVHALGDLTLGVPVRALELIRSRKREGPRVDLIHLARSATRHVRGRGVQEGHTELPFSRQVSGHVDQILGPEGVDVERVVQGRVEVDHPGGVHDGRERASNLRANVIRDTAKGLRDVSRNHRDLLGHHGVIRTAWVALANGLKDLRGRDLRPEALLRCLRHHTAPLALPHHEVDVRHLREVMQQHGEPHLAEESRPPHDEESRAIQLRAHVEGVRHRIDQGWVLAAHRHAPSPSS